MFTLAITSPRGGAGKTTLTTNLAACLALSGKKVGVLDGNLRVPGLSPVMGMTRMRVIPSGARLDAANGPLGIRMLSADIIDYSTPISFLTEDSQDLSIEFAAVNRQPLEVAELLERANFGVLDYLLIDMPWASAEIEQLAGRKMIDAVLFTSQSSAYALEPMRVAIEQLLRAGVRVAGIVANMAGFYCSNCQSVRPLFPQGNLSALSLALGVPVLSSLSFDARLAEISDRGGLFVREFPDAPLAKKISSLAQRLVELANTDKVDR